MMINNFQIDHKTYNNKSEASLFLIISLLHINGFINKTSVHALFKRLKKGKLNRWVNTYKSDINGKWYNDESILEVYSDVFDSMMNPKGKEKMRINRLNKLRSLNGLPPKSYKTYLSFEETLKYLNMFLNKNKNFCIDHLFYEHIKPLVQSENFQELNKMFNCDFSVLEKTSTYSDDYYCCEYCCGEYDDWINSNSYRDQELYQKEITKKISEFLNTKRTKYKGSYKEFK